jgi:photosystem II stability/assembly factor-like uncharacterized protein
MKMLIFLIVIFLTTSLHAQWEWQNPLPQGNSLNAVHFIDENEGWAVGWYGTILHTTDAGISWEKININTTDYFNDLIFIGHDTGWVVGYGMIYHTNDGGNTWIEQNIPVPLNCQSVCFINVDEGWVVGSNHTIIHTSNGGLHWEEQDSGLGTEYVWLESVCFINEHKGYACGWDGIILRTLNGGISWELQPTGTDDQLNSIFFQDQFTGWALGGCLLQTTNGGYTWLKVDTVESIRGYSICFTDNLNGWICGSNIYRTTDGGVNWEQMEDNTNMLLHDISFIGNSSGWIVGSGGKIMAYKPEEDKWISLSQGLNWDLMDVMFIDENEGWVAGRTIQHTTDGGKTWQEQLPGAHVYCVHFEDNRNGWAAGNKQIYNTKDGGDSWSLQLDLGKGGYDTSFQSIVFTDTLHGWALDFYGLVLHTNDGGQHWVEQSSGLNVQQNQIFALNQMKAWIAGGYGWISITSDGGNTWTAFQTGFQYSYNWDIQFIDNMHGWMNGDGFLYTEDGGLSWERISNAGGYSFYFTDINNGWLTGGGIYHTSDGGHTWQVQNQLTNYSIYSIWFHDENNGWAVGDGGIILHTDNGGAVGTNELNVQGTLFNVECFPNPFSSLTTLEYMLESPSYVQLEIYNVAGQQVDMLNFGKLQAGVQTITWHAGNCPKGLYFYKLIIDKQSITGKLILK